MENDDEKYSLTLHCYDCGKNIPLPWEAAGAADIDAVWICPNCWGEMI